MLWYWAKISILAFNNFTGLLWGHWIVRFYPWLSDVFESSLCRPLIFSRSSRILHPSEIFLTCEINTFFRLHYQGTKFHKSYQMRQLLPFPWQYTQSAAFFKSLQIFLSILHIYADLIHPILDPIQLF